MTVATRTRRRLSWPASDWNAEADATAAAVSSAANSLHYSSYSMRLTTAAADEKLAFTVSLQEHTHTHIHIQRHAWPCSDIKKDMPIKREGYWAILRFPIRIDKTRQRKWANDSVALKYPMLFTIFLLLPKTKLVNFVTNLSFTEYIENYYFFPSTALCKSRDQPE